MQAIQFLNASDKYYFEKWGLSLKKGIKSRLRIARFKKMVLVCMFRFKKAKGQTLVIRYYKLQLRQLNVANS